MEKVNERVNWCMDSEINNVWQEVTGTIKIIPQEVLKSRGRVVYKVYMVVE